MACFLGRKFNLKAVLFVIVVVVRVGVKKFLLLRTTICSVINNKGALNIFGLDFHHKWSRQNKQAEAILGKRTNS